MPRKYYEAYNERYLTAHAKGVSWAGEVCSKIVLDTIEKYGLEKQSMLEIGCGEGRDAKAVLEKGCRLLATDISEEAIRYCKEQNPSFKDNFQVLDCINGKLEQKFDFIYAMAVIHMLVLDEDRAAFYGFLGNHLTENGLALVCSMGDGEMEMQTDIETAFNEVDRNHETGKMKVACTSCRMVNTEHFKEEIEKSGLVIVECGLTECLPNFNSMLYAVVRKV